MGAGSEPPRERADAARNRRRVLAATAALLARHGTEHVSIDEVAAAAGVGKGTVFRRFGSREGLFRALVEERVATLAEAVRSGAPPLGPGASARLRLSAFAEAIVDVAAANVAFMTAYEHALTAAEPTALGRRARPVYQDWHTHIATLIAQERPDVDAELLADVVLGSLHTDLARRLLGSGQSPRLAASLQHLIAAVLDSSPHHPDGAK